MTSREILGKLPCFSAFRCHSPSRALTEFLCGRSQIMSINTSLVTLPGTWQAINTWWLLLLQCGIGIDCPRRASVRGSPRAAPARSRAGKSRSVRGGRAALLAPDWCHTRPRVDQWPGETRGSADPGAQVLHSPHRSPPAPAHRHSACSSASAHPSPDVTTAGSSRRASSTSLPS